jgi:hypothetical protein
MGGNRELQMLKAELKSLFDYDGSEVVLEQMEEKYHPHRALFMNMAIEESLPAAAFFLGGGGQDIYNLPPNVDIPFRIFVLLYDVSLFPYWYPLILSGATGGAGYDDLFRCVFDSGPFIPCLHENLLISDDQFQCYFENGVAIQCLLIGNVFTQKEQGTTQADRLGNTGYNNRKLWKEKDDQSPIAHSLSLSLKDGDAEQILHAMEVRKQSIFRDSRNLFFEGYDTLDQATLQYEVFARVFIFILDFFILGPLGYYWAIFFYGGWNFYPDLIACLIGPPPFEDCLINSGLKT